MLTPQALAWGALAAVGAAAACFLLAARRFYVSLPRRPRGLLRGCLRVFLEHAQTDALLLAAACVLPCFILPVALAASRFNGAAGGILLFIPAAVLSALAALALCAAAAAGACWLALRRFQGGKADFFALAGALFRRLGGVRRWAGAALRRPEELPFNPFVLPALLSSDADLAEAAARAAAFAAESPRAVEAAAPLQALLSGAVLAVLGVFLPLCLGFFSLPLVASMGYTTDLAWGLDLYVALWSVLGAALCAALVALTLLACAALVHAGAIYLYATGGAETRERVLRRFQREWVWPQEAAAAPAVPAPAKAAAAPAPVPAPAPPPPVPLAGAVPIPEPQEYAQERILPAAGKRDLDIGAPPQAGGDVVFYPDALAPQMKPKLFTFSRGKLALLRGLLVGGALCSAFAIFAAYDGWDLVHRQRVNWDGVPVRGVVEAVEPETKWGVLQYRMTLSFEGSGLSGRAQTHVGEAARILAPRGAKVPAHALSRGGRVLVALDDDYAFTGQRAALLLALTGFLLVGAWSFAFRVL